MDKKIPTFLGIGAAKSGTTWLYTQLSQHPQIWLPPVKELHYFDRSSAYLSPNTLAYDSLFDRLRSSREWRQSLFQKGSKEILKYTLQGNWDLVKWYTRWYFGHYDDNWYLSLFPKSEAYQACGEITPAYSILNLEDVAHIKRLNPEVRLIFIIRDPVEQAWSSLRYCVDRGMEDLDLTSTDAIVQKFKSSSLSQRRNYLRTLDNYLSHFDSDQLLLCFYDAIQRQPMRLLQEITGFLDVSPIDGDTLDLKKRINASSQRSMPSAVRECLLDLYGPYLQTLGDRLGSYAALWSTDAEPAPSPAEETADPKHLPPAIHV